MHESPKACFNISKVSLPVLPNLTQNLMHTLCLSTSAILPISKIRRQLMQYTHKNTCNNQTLPHPTTSLSTLTHKTPPQHNLAGTRELQATCMLWALSWDFWIHLHICADTYTHNIHKYMHTYTHAYMDTYIHTCAHTHAFMVYQFKAAFIKVSDCPLLTTGSAILSTAGVN